MQADDWQKRFGGIARLYGDVALHRFRHAHFCVVGMGGVGSWATEALARSGIGTLSLIDMDEVCITNTNRQIHALQGAVGQLKVEVLAQRIQLINPACRVAAIDDFVSVHNIPNLITTEMDYVIDAIDSLAAKAALVAWCRRNKIPLITVGAAGGKIDPTQIKVADLAKTIQDPLAAKLRERLKRDYAIKKDSRGKLGIDCVFSAEARRYPQADGSVCAVRASGTNAGKIDCAQGLGATTVVTATFGFIAVAHALKKLQAKIA